MMVAVQAVVSSMASCGHTVLQEFPHLLILSVSCSKYKHLYPTGLVLSFFFLTTNITKLVISFTYTCGMCTCFHNN